MQRMGRWPEWQSGLCGIRRLHHSLNQLRLLQVSQRHSKAPFFFGNIIAGMMKENCDRRNTIQMSHINTAKLLSCDLIGSGANQINQNMYVMDF